jgi:hypothetical protein
MKLLDKNAREIAMPMVGVHIFIKIGAKNFVRDKFGISINHLAIQPMQTLGIQ